MGLLNMIIQKSVKGAEKKYFGFIFVFLSFLLLASCSHLFGDDDKEKSENEYVTVTGKIILGDALPEEILNLWNSPVDGHEQSRSAFPSIPAASSLSCIFTVYNADTNAAIAASGSNYTATASDDKTTYTAIIPKFVDPKNYRIKLVVFNNGSQILSGQTEDFSVSEEEPVFSKDISLTPSKNGMGIFSLAVTVDNDTGISSGKIADHYVNATVDGTTFTFAKGTISPGSLSDGTYSGVYPMKFDFYSGASGSGELLYSFTEVITILDGLSTNVWMQNGEEPWFTTTTDANGIKTTSCHITKAMVDSFKLTEIYVDTSATTSTESGTFMNPCMTFSTALTKLRDASKDYTIYIKGTVTGMQTLPTTLKKTGSGGSYTYAKSLTICGARGLDENGVPLDRMNGGRTETANGTTLKILTEVPVIIKDIKITGGYAAQSSAGGGGIYSKGDLTLESGALINGNHTLSCGGGIYNDGGTLRIKSGAVISENTEVSSVSGCGGGGIFNYNGIIIMSGGTIKANTANHNGGGIYSEIDDADKLCAIYIYGDAVIGGDTAADGNKALGTSSDGGGIYNKGGLVYLGCTDYLKIGGMDTIQYYFPDPSKNVPWTGKMSHNSAGLLGGGIVNYPGPSEVGMKGYGMIHIQSGKICSNTASGGGGVMIQNGSLFYLNGGTIGGDNSSEGNSATSQGGGIYSLGKFFINRGTVSYNTAAAGGGIYDSMGIDMYGGTVKNNTATSYGGGIYMESRSLNLSGNAYIPAGSDGSNDVYLTLGSDPTNNPTSKVLITASITPPEECTDGIVAKITPSDYSDENKILVLSESATTEIEDEYQKFDIIPKDLGGGVTETWVIDISGQLKKLVGKKKKPDAKYDIVFNDGSATAYTSDLTLTDDEKNAAIAVIFYVGTECSNDNTTYRKLGVGLKQSDLSYWCLGEENMVGCAAISCEAFGGPGNWNWQSNPDKNGSDNLQQFAECLVSNGRTNTTANASAYPAFYFAINYSTVSGSHVSGTDYATGWYFPSLFELSRIYLESQAVATTVNTLNAALTKCGGTTFYTSGDHIYGSSSTDESAYYCTYLGFLTNTYGASDQYDLQRNASSDRCIAIAVHEF